VARLVHSVARMAPKTLATQMRQMPRMFAPSMARCFSGVSLRPTDPAPDFVATAVVDGEFKEVSLEDYKGKYLVLFFYPLDFTFVCPTEIISFSERAQEFRDIGCEVAAVSVDSEHTHLAWINTPRKQGGLGEMKIPLIADITKTISYEYGVLLEDKGIALRGTYVIDPEGVVRAAQVHDLPVGRSVDETLRVVKAFQFVDQHGDDVCPANWTPGEDTMKANHDGASAYFSKQE